MRANVGVASIRLARSKPNRSALILFELSIRNEWEQRPAQTRDLFALIRSDRALARSNSTVSRQRSPVKLIRLMAQCSTLANALAIALSSSVPPLFFFSSFIRIEVPPMKNAPIGSHDRLSLQTSAKTSLHRVSSLRRRGACALCWKQTYRQTCSLRPASLSQVKSVRQLASLFITFSSFLLGTLNKLLARACAVFAISAVCRLAFAV